MGAPSIVRLPDGQHFTVKPVFAGLFFKSHELSTHPHSFPIGWTVVLHTQDPNGVESRRPSADSTADSDAPQGGQNDQNDRNDQNDEKDHGSNSPRKQNGMLAAAEHRPRVRAYTRPTLHDDCLFISSISNPSSSDFKPAASPTRQIAMMLWITLYWYFHQQPVPDSVLPATDASLQTRPAGRPRGEWRINIRRDGVLRARNLLPKLERMGLVATLDSAVGIAPHDAHPAEGAWDRIFVSRRAFWQIPARLFLFTLQPSPRHTDSYPGSPASSRPVSPAQGNPLVIVPDTGGLDDDALVNSRRSLDAALEAVSTVASIMTQNSFPMGPFYSSSHLPTYYPPAPPQYTITNHVRHPMRPKPPRSGEVFYSRFVPSAGSYLSFRVASLSPRPVTYQGAVGPSPPPQGAGARHGQHHKNGGVPRIRAATMEHAHLGLLSDTELLKAWLSKPRVAAFWGSFVPDFLPQALALRHSFPVVAMWDGVPFAYLEVYWLKEDPIGRHLGAFAGGSAADWDRGVHVLVGEEWARGLVPLWLSSMVHWVFTADYRTMSVVVEPRIDNERFIQHLQAGGFVKEMELSLPHKQAWFGRLRRENWEGPAL
ncbi:hypothetical protein RB598_004771 [Gaeumannomyces tritici]